MTPWACTGVAHLLLVGSTSRWQWTSRTGRTCRSCEAIGCVRLRAKEGEPSILARLTPSNASAQVSSLLCSRQAHTNTVVTDDGTAGMAAYAAQTQVAAMPQMAQMGVAQQAVDPYTAAAAAAASYYYYYPQAAADPNVRWPFCHPCLCHSLPLLVGAGSVFPLCNRPGVPRSTAANLRNASRNHGHAGNYHSRCSNNRDCLCCLRSGTCCAIQRSATAVWYH